MSRRQVIFVLGLGVLVLLVYLPSFPGEFHFDDYALMLENPQVIAPHFSYRLFLEQYGGRPLTLWTFHWNYRLAGTDPWSYHAFNLLLHLAAAGLMLLWVRRQIRDERAAIWAAAVFALHPLQTQAVNYVWSRSVLLMFCFGMASLLLAGRKADDSRFGSLAPWLSLLSFQMAIWSRADGVIFLIPLLLAGGVPRRLKDGLSILHRNPGPTLVALINIGAFALSMLQYRPREMGWTHPQVLDYWWSQTVAFWKYVGAMFWPVALSVDHHFSVTRSWAPILALGGLLVSGFILWKVRARFPLVVGGSLWICLALAPAALLPNSDPFNESRAYPALAGFAVVLASILQIAWTRLPRLSVVTAAAFVMLAMMPATVARNRVWHSDLALWQDAAEKSPQKARVHYNLGAARARAGDIGRAEQAFKRALVLDPHDDLTHAALGYCAESRRDWALALQCYQRAVSLNAHNSYAHEGRQRVLGHVDAGLNEQRL